MGRGKLVEIAGLSFQTHAAFKEHVRKMLNDLPQGVILGEPHHSFLVCLLKRRAKAAEKIGAGIKHFKILNNKNYGGFTKCFYIFREDGTHSDFSYQKCISAPTPWEECVDALTGAVMDQMIRAREEAFGVNDEIFCPVKSIKISRSASYIDTAPPYTFDVLIEQWMDEEWLQKEDPPKVEDGGQKTSRRLVDKEMEARWQYFYATHAKHRVISVEAHSEATLV